MVADGQPLVEVAATMQRDPQGIMVRKDSSIHSFADLNGHTISIKPGYTWFAYLVKHNQLNSIHEIPATMSVANFVADRSTSRRHSPPRNLASHARPAARPAYSLISDAGYNPYRVIFTMRDFLQQHPEIAAKFVRASLQAWCEYLNDPTAAHAAIAKLNPALNAEWMSFTWQALRDGHFVTGHDPSGAQVGQMAPNAGPPCTGSSLI